MTDEEKAEDFVRLKICGNNKLNVYCPYSSCSTEECVAKVSYLIGLAEGRKDRNCVNCSNHGKQFEVMKLKKENAKAKELIKTLLLIADNKVSQLEFILCVAEAEQFLKEIAE